jgi:hypothetical protein
LGPADQRPHLRRRIGSRPQPQGLDTPGQRADEGVAGLGHGNGDRDRHATLAGRSVSRAHQRIGSARNVGVGHDDHVVLGACQRLNAFAMSGGGDIDVTGDGRRADEADGRDVRMGE